MLSVNLFVFQDTQAAAMVDVALRKAGLEVDPSLYCLVEIDNVTGGYYLIISLILIC